MARPIDTNAAARRISAHLNALVRDIGTLTRGLQNAAQQAAKKSVGSRRAPRRRARSPRRTTRVSSSRASISG